MHTSFRHSAENPIAERCDLWNMSSFSWVNEIMADWPAQDRAEWNDQTTARNVVLQVGQLQERKTLALQRRLVDRAKRFQ